MKFLVDECVGLGVAQWLQNQGYDAISILEVSPGISDEAVLQKAFFDGRILITMDKDFGDMVFRIGRNHSGIILIRLNNWALCRKIDVLQDVLNTQHDYLENNFIVVTDESIRIIRTKVSAN